MQGFIPADDRHGYGGVLVRPADARWQHQTATTVGCRCPWSLFVLMGLEIEELTPGVADATPVFPAPHKHFSLGF